jgi:hypothetical protein
LQTLPFRVNVSISEGIKKLVLEFGYEGYLVITSRTEM